MKKMNKPILILVLTSFVAIGSLNSCASEENRLKKDKAEINQANKKTELAEDKYYEEMEEFKKDNLEKISANQKSVAEFNKRILDEKQDAKEEYLTKIAALDQKNTDLKKKLDDYKESGKENWTTFKNEFSKDMDELGKAFKEFTHK